jgi:hypothetical protein
MDAPICAVTVFTKPVLGPAEPDSVPERSAAEPDGGPEQLETLAEAAFPISKRERTRTMI